MPEVLVSGEISFPSFQTATFLLCLHMTFLRMWRERELWFLFLSYKDISTIVLGPHFLCPNFNYLLKDPILEYSHIGS